MTPITKTPSTKTNSDTVLINYTPTGFGQLPVPQLRTKRSLLKPSNLQFILLIIALILCLFGVIYLLLFVTLTL